ncbi:MAG TPA: MFS transporter [Bradyrhizobium sp.]|jgi:MFS family permease|nr:MFS transporter [Bradyrhizobium sp.]
MQRRWLVLAILFLARMCLAYQFQTIAAITPVLRTELGLDLGDAGLLIGLYALPGVILPLAGGAIGHVAGDRFAVTLGFILAIVGGLVPILIPGWTALIAGRLLAGAGGVIVSVIMTKMVADWFANAEIAGAMAVFVNSWPAGIILALFSLPTVAATSGSHAALIVSAAVVACGLALFLGFYGATRTDAVAANGAAKPRVTMPRGVVVSLIAAGLIWGFYNVASTITFSFGVTLLTERGYSAASAASTVTLVLFLSMVSVPLGGFLADRLDSANLILTLGSVVFAAMLVAAGRLMESALIFAAIGLIGGIPAGVIMKLPARVLLAEQRAIGMGIFYTISYGGLVLGTAIGGELADRWDTSSAAFDFAAVLVAACPLLLLAVRQKPASMDATQGASRV